MPKCANIHSMAQVKARIVVAQGGNPPPEGYESGSRDLLLQGTTITLTNLSNTSVSSHEWSFDFPPNQTADNYTITGQTGPTCTITTLPDPRGYGDVKVKLIVTGPPVGGKRNVSVDEIILGIPKPMEGYDAGFPVPHPKEGGAGTRATLNASTGAMGRVSQLAMAALQYLGGTADNYPRPIQVAIYADSNIDVHAGPQTIQGYSCVEGTVVWLNAQTDPAEQGLWIVVADDWIRHPAADSSADITAGLLVQIVQGTYGEKLFMAVWDDPAGSKVLGTDEVKAIEVTGGTGGTLPQPLDTTDSPTFAGLTLTSFSGFLKATAGVLSAAALALSDLPTGSAGTVLTGTGGAPAYSATPVLTAIKDSATTAATAGLVRGSNATTLVAARNAANDANWTILSTDETGIIVGAATGPSLSLKTATTVTFGAASPWVSIDANGVTLEGNSGALRGGDDSGSVFSLIQCENTDITIGGGVATSITVALATGTFAVNSGTGGLYITPGAAILVTAYSGSTSITYGWQDKTANSATGSATNILGQNCTGTTTTGGAVNVLTGSGTSANGELNLGTGGVTRLTLSSTGKILYFASSLTTAVVLTQANLSTDSATGARLDILAQTCTGTSSTGGEVRVGSGAGTTRDGYITFYRGTSQKGQIGNGSGGGTWFGSSSTVTGSAGFGAGSGHTISGIAGFASGASNSVSGNYGTSFGGSCSSSADYTISGGYTCSASVFAAVALGNTTTASANGACALGILTTAANVASMSVGSSSYASTYGEFAHASGAATGGPQNSVIQIAGTTSATASTNVDLKAGPSSDQEVITRSNRIYLVRVDFVVTSASFTVVGGGTLKNALVKNTSGTVTVIDAGTQENTASTPADWVVSLAGSGTNLRVNFLKTADATALRCTAKVTLVEIAKA